jgi:cobalt-zinc-cadmium efflux system membrane fusion protein
VNENPSGVNLMEPPADPRTAEAGRRAGRGRSVLGCLARAVPNLLVLLSLAALGYWGHQTGWKLPKFAEVGGGETPKDDWCEEHGVPESRCVECQADLMPRRVSHGWCDAHGVFDCPWEHPEVAQLRKVPAVTPADLERARRALETPRPTNSTKCPHFKRRIQFASDEAAAKAGVETAPAWRGGVTESVTAHGEVGYDPNRVAQLATPVPGRVWKVFKELGQPAATGEVLALVNSSEVSKAKTEFRSALAQLGLADRDVARYRPLSGKSVAEAELQRAEAAQEQAQIRLADARQALANLGLPVQTADHAGRTPDEVSQRLRSLGVEGVTGLDRTAPEGLIPVKATRAGAVVARKVIEGDLVDPSRTLFVVADTSRMTLTLNVRQEDARLLRARDERRGTPGQEVRFRPEGFDGEVTGEVTWVSTAADEKTRTVQVRADLAAPGNPNDQLRANTFGTGRVILREEKQAVLVLSEAVQWEGDAFVVFVRDRDYKEPEALKVFHTRVVRPGARDGGNTEVIAGLLPGEVVVTRGSGVLRSELLKNALGEG